MKMHTQLAIVIGSLAAVGSLSSNVLAESALGKSKVEMPKAEMAMPKAEKSLPAAESDMPKSDMPKGDMPKTGLPVEAPIDASPKMTPEKSAPEAIEASPKALPADEMMPSMKMPPISAPEVAPKGTKEEVKETLPMPTAPMTVPSQMPSQRPPADLPELKSVPMPVEPKVSTTSTPTGNPSAAATTMVLPRETITGITSVDLPAPPIQAAYFTLPIDLRVAKDANIASSTPISDRYTAKGSWDIKAWASAVSGCLQQKPKLVRVVGNDQVPFMLNGSEGTIMLNSSDKAVCSM
jgi:hypothetical protein